MKVKNKWIFLSCIIFSLLVVSYYIYIGPYKFQFKGLEVKAAFPSKPTLKQVPAGYSNGITGASDIYELSKPGITYIVSITAINEEARVAISENKLLNYFNQHINLLSGVKFKNSQATFLDEFNGQTIAFASKEKLLYGQFYLTRNAIVAIFTRQQGTSLKSGARQFIESLSIVEKINELKNF